MEGKLYPSQPRAESVKFRGRLRLIALLEFAKHVVQLPYGACDATSAAVNNEPGAFRVNDYIMSLLDSVLLPHYGPGRVIEAEVRRGIDGLASRI